MCGILGLFAKRNIQETTCLKALHRMTHRGPNDFGYFSNQDVFLGHRRLAIVGLENGKQPLSSEDGGIKAVVNGAFYNYRKIRKQLQDKGHVFSTDSDSEILVHLYEEYGEKCLEELEGEFAFILWDKHTKKVFAARDRFGVKPLYYALFEGQLILSSEMKTMLELGVPTNWNTNALQSVFTSQYLPKNGALIKGIQQIEPGHFLVFENDSLSLQKYWDIPQQHIHEQHVSSPATMYDLLNRAVQKRLDCDVSVACHLSGGIDSAAISALVAKHYDKAVDCFTVVFPTEGYNELARAKEQAKFIGATLHEVEVRTEDIIENYERAVYFSESLAINGQLVAKYVLNKALFKAGYKVVLGGEGADEVLFGYPHLKQDYYGGQHAALLKQNPLLKGIMLDEYQKNEFQTLDQKLGYVPAFLAAKLKLGNRLSEVLSDEILAIDGASLFLDQYAFDYHYNIETSRYLWTKSAFANYILNGIGDGTEMANSVEGRLPFLDKDVVAFAATLNWNELFHNGEEKNILREAMKGAVTETIRKCPKHPFIAPPIDIFNSKIGEEFVNDLFHSKEFSAIPFVDVKKSRELLQKLKFASDSDKIKYDAVVHILISLTMFSKNFKMT